MLNSLKSEGMGVFREASNRESSNSLIAICFIRCLRVCHIGLHIEAEYANRRCYVKHKATIGEIGRNRHMKHAQ